MNLPLSLPSPPLPAGERVAEGREGDSDRFKVPMHGCKAEGALYELLHLAGGGTVTGLCDGASVVLSVRVSPCSLAVKCA